MICTESPIYRIRNIHFSGIKNVFNYKITCSHKNEVLRSATHLFILNSTNLLEVAAALTSSKKYYNLWKTSPHCRSGPCISQMLIAALHYTWKLQNVLILGIYIPVLILYQLDVRTISYYPLPWILPYLKTDLNYLHEEDKQRTSSS